MLPYWHGLPIVIAFLRCLWTRQLLLETQDRCRHSGL